MNKFVANSIALVVASTLAGGALAQSAPRAPAADAPAPAGAEMKKLPPTQPGTARPAQAAPAQPGMAAEPAKPGQPEGQKPAAAGEPEKPAPGQKAGQAEPAQNGGKPAAGAPAKPGAPRAGAAKAPPKISSEQRTQVVHSFRSVSVHPVSVNFALNVGVAVPQTVVLAPVPTEVITVVPEYEGYEFFETAGSIVIVDPNTLEIVAVLPL